jgi:hypothetical protein
MGSTAYILPEDLPEDIRRRLDSPNYGASLYLREFEAFQKSLFERVIRESGGESCRGRPDASAGTRIRSAADAMN